MTSLTEKPLKERWLTPEGKKVRQQIIEHIREQNWERFLVGFPFVKDIKNGRDLRFIDLNRVEDWGTNHTRAAIYRANLRGVNISGVDLREANLWRAHLSEAFLWRADFRGANLRETRFEGVALWETRFEGVALESACFSNCTIKDTKFNGCEIDNITFESSIIINVDWGNSKIKRRYFKNLKPFNEDYIGLMETYISLKNQFNKNGLYNDMSWAYLKEKESLRLHYKQNIAYKKINVRDRTKSFFKYIWEYILFFLFGYGERPWHILGWSFLTIIIYGLIYKITNAIGSSLQDIDTGVTFWRSLYFSTITFTTVGFGDFHPLRDIPRIFVMTEAASGLFFYSLFVFTFGRRIAGR